MQTLIHIPILTISGFALIFMWRFYACINRMGYTREVGRRAPDMVHGDTVAATFFMMPFFMAAADWTDIVFPKEPISTNIALFLSICFLAGSMFILRDSGERFVGSWVGSVESALRTVAALGIITNDELTYGLDYISARENEGQGLGRIIEENVHGRRK